MQIGFGIQSCFKIILISEIFRIVARIDRNVELYIGLHYLSFLREITRQKELKRRYVVVENILLENSSISFLFQF